MVDDRSLTVEQRDDGVRVVEFSRPPDNYFDAELVGEIADAYGEADVDPACRAIVLCSAGRHFCAGADFGKELGIATEDLYAQAVRLFAAGTPVVAAVQGVAIGGGLGVALSADLRVASPETRFQANFARLGIHHGFGITVTLPATVGEPAALDLLLTGRRVAGEEARTLGLCDRLAASTEELRPAALALAAEIAAAAPLAVASIRRTMRDGLAQRIRAATAVEAREQATLFTTADFAEGVAAASERRVPRFRGE